MKKTCTKCGDEKEIGEFPKDKTKKDGYDCYCKICKKARIKQHYNDPLKKELHNKKSRDWNDNPKNRKSRLASHQKYRNKPEVKIKADAYNKVYHFIPKNKEKRLKKMKEYYSKEENREHRRKWSEHKRKNDPIFKLKTNIRTRIFRALKENKKLTGSAKLLGCETIQYKQYLETQFLSPFTWENYGIVWEIDHIEPINSFDLSTKEGQEKAFHYTNTMPRFITTAIAKSFGFNNEIGNRDKGKKSSVNKPSL